jgi:3-deoxy-D-manno-octulosonic-acid transferase
MNEHSGALTRWSALSYLLLPYALLGLLWRGLRYRPYFSRWRERFGFVPRMRGERVIWVHAVSVGEVRSAAELVRGFQQRYPRYTILVTTMTPTGAEQVAKLFHGAVAHCYLPYDFPDAVERFLDRVDPRLAVIAETEFWPNLYAACRRRQVPLALVNVRISATALAGYLRIPRTARAMFTAADVVCAQTRTDAQRLRNLGVPEHKLFVTGNLKFDSQLGASAPGSADFRADLRTHARYVVVAGSTHAGEERRLLDAYTRLVARWPDLLLVIAPRNPERFGAVARLCRRRGFATELRSENAGVPAASTEIVVADTMGELLGLYADADVAFVGGSLVKRGGHNILEPCALGVPVVFGPHMFHFEEIAALALESGAGRQVYDAAELAEVLALYLSEPALRRAAGAAAVRMVESHTGALAATFALVARELHRLELIDEGEATGDVGQRVTERSSKRNLAGSH